MQIRPKKKHHWWDRFFRSKIGCRNAASYFFMCVGHDITSSPLKYGSRVFVAKCSEPQAGNGDVMSEGSG